MALAPSYHGGPDAGTADFGGHPNLDGDLSVVRRGARRGIGRASGSASASAHCSSMTAAAGAVSCSRAAADPIVARAELKAGGAALTAGTSTGAGAAAVFVDIGSLSVWAVAVSATTPTGSISF